MVCPKMESAAQRRISDMRSRNFSSMSIGSYGGGTQKIDSRPALVIEIGKRITRVGIAGEFVPREMFCTCYVDSIDFQTYDIFSDAYSESEQHVLLLKFFKDIVFRRLLTTVNGRRVVIVESLLTPTKIRNAIAKAFFEGPSLSPHSITFAPSQLLCTFPFNAKTCMVVDLGVDETTLFPVAEGVVMLNHYDSTPLGAAAVERNVCALLRRYARIRFSTSTDAADRAVTDADLHQMDAQRLMEDVVFRFCFVTTLERGRKLQRHSQDPNEPIEQPPPGVELPLGTDVLVLPGIVREAAAEALFEVGDMDNKSLPQIILDTLLKVPIDLRRVFLNNLLVVGGVGRMRGLLGRLRAELLILLSAEERYRSLSELRDVGFLRLPVDINLELYCAWLGGSMLGTLDDVVENRSITRDDWLAQLTASRHVPDWTAKIDDYFRMFDETKGR